jgi:dolichol-phosphate mannosyltransferase
MKPQLTHKKNISQLPLRFRGQGIKRFMQFCLVGMSGLLVDMTVLFVISDPSMVGLPAPLGKAFAVQVAILNNFLWNELWTFRDRTAGNINFISRFNRLLRFNAICMMGLIIGVGIIWVLHEKSGWNLYVANVYAIAMMTGWNFGMNLKFSWRINKPGAGHI